MTSEQLESFDKSFPPLHQGKVTHSQQICFQNFKDVVGLNINLHDLNFVFI